ncbi:MAG TPA: methyl-accepting chemotaxis protein [Anaeromyxobacteraceae bacterium]|nr:methyl-accepting chemotaxis protein [Anaeromyxobacteraceae bacterium]
MTSTAATGPGTHGRLRRKVAAATGAAVLVAFALALGAFEARMRRLADDALRRRAEAVCETIAQGLASGSAAPQGLARWLEGVRASAPDLVRVAVLGRSGSPIAEARDPARAGESGLVVSRRPVPGGAAAAEVEVAIAPGSGPTLVAGAPARVATVALAAAALAAALGWLLARRVTAPASAVAQAARRMAGGDLRLDVRVARGDEMSEVAESLSRLSGGLRAALGELRESAGAMAKKAHLVSESTRQQARAVAGQTAALEETAHNVIDLARTSRAATESARLVIDVATRSESLWTDGEQAVRGGMEGLRALDARVGAIAESVTELSEETVRIAGIIATVKDLSEQSNVLALNASIEAAKVGEEGRGFAIVAGEMRRLAEQSQRATAEVRARLVALQRATRRVVSATAEGSESARAAGGSAAMVGEKIAGLAAAFEESARAARAIAETTQKQAEEMEGIAAAVEFLHETMRDTVEGARRTEESARELDQLAERLGRATSAYEI